MLGPPVGGLAPREANGDQDRAASSHRDAPSRGERGRGPRPRHRPERGSVRDRRGGDPRQPRGYTGGKLAPRLPGISRVRQARPQRPRTLGLGVPHRPLRRAHAARGSRLGLPSRTLPPKRGPPPTLLDPVAHVLGAERPLPPAQVAHGFARVRVELLLQRLHNRNAAEPFARKSTRTESPVVRCCPMLSEKVRGRLDTAASGSPKRPRRAPWRPRRRNGTRPGDRSVPLPAVLRPR